MSSRYHAPSDNPYKEGTREHAEWAAGFNEAIAETVKSILG